MISMQPALSPQLPHKLIFKTTHGRLWAGGHVVPASECPFTSYAQEAELSYISRFGAERGERRVVRDGRQERDRQLRIQGFVEGWVGHRSSKLEQERQER